jgi:hypothetical protein
MSNIRTERTEHQKLKQAVLDYLSECDNPVPDYMYRWNLRNNLRTLTGAPAAPAARSPQGIADAE